MTITNALNYYPNIENICYAGDFNANPWQRGTSFTVSLNGSTFPAGNSYTADGFQIYNNTSGTLTISQTAAAPTVALTGGVYSPLCFGVTVTGATPSLSATQGGAILYKMEGYDWAKIYQRSFTLSFYVFSSVTGVYSVMISDTTTLTNYYVTTYTIAAASTWQKVVLTIPADPFNDVTWNFTSGAALQILFVLGCGSGGTTSTLNTWVDSSTFKYAATTQANAFATASNVFYINLIQIEQGVTANPFQIIVQETTLQKCMRYYQKTFTQATAPAQNTGLTGAVVFYMNVGSGSSATQNLSYMVPMRTTPSLTTFNPQAAAPTIRNVSAANNGNIPAINVVTEKALTINFTTSTSVTNDLYALQYVLNASL